MSDVKYWSISANMLMRPDNSSLTNTSLSSNGEPVSEEWVARRKLIKFFADKGIVFNGEPRDYRFLFIFQADSFSQVIERAKEISDELIIEDNWLWVCWGRVRLLSEVNKYNSRTNIEVQFGPENSWVLRGRYELGEAEKISLPWAIGILAIVAVLCVLFLFWS